MDITSSQNTNSNMIRLDIEGMHCSSCASLIEKTVAKVPGVASVNVNFATSQGTVKTS